MKMTLDGEYCLKADTRVLGVAGEVNGREITFRGLEVAGAASYKIKFGLPDNTSFEGEINDGKYTIPATPVLRAGKVQVQIIAANGTAMIRKSQILTMIVVDSIDYEPHESGAGERVGTSTALTNGTNISNTGVATYHQFLALTNDNEAEQEEM
jgi:hypothetical protein